MACNDKNPLQRDGSSQSQRFLKALDPAYAPVEELGMKEWLTFAAAYADKINYFNLKDSDHPQGDWKPFFIENSKAIDDFIQQAQLKINNAELPQPDTDIIGNIEPHLALFLSFILLLQHSKDALNLFTGRHLDFYFKEVLQLRNRPEVPDKVHVIFELARNLSSYRLPAGTKLDAGKDKGVKPKPLAYTTINELAVNNAAIVAMKSWYQSAADKKVAYADVSFSADGLGTPFKDDNPKWNAFGNANWPVASMGFAFASKVLLMAEGDRTITLTLSFNSSPGISNMALLQQQFKVFLTSEKDWLQADFPTSNAFAITTSGGISQLVVTVNVSAKAKAIVPYDKAVHKENYNTTYPVIRLLMNMQGDNYDVYQALSKANLAKVQIDVAVKGMKNLAVENDNGKLDPSKPFFAFGPQPKKGSNLYIGSAEIFQKEWSEIIPNIQWKNQPGNFKDYYTCYRKDFVKPTFYSGVYLINASDQATDSAYGGRIISSVDSFTAAATYIRNGEWYPADAAAHAVGLFGNTVKLNPDGASQPAAESQAGESKFADRHTYFNSHGGGAGAGKAQEEKAFIEESMGHAGAGKRKIGFRGFDNVGDDVQTKTDSFSAGVKDNYVRLTLQQDFLHSVYPQLYAVAMSSTVKTVLIPQAPYTPEVAALTVDYKASAKNDINNLFTITDAATVLNDYVNRNVQFFHETPFGQAEQHAFLKAQYAGLVDTNLTLIPKAPDLSGFYIGLSNMLTGSVASILFQVAEGSEDATAPSFTDVIKPIWYFLSGNEWIALDKNNIISDDTNNFLRSGIIKFLIPDGAVTDNTFLNQGLTWLGVELPPSVSINSVCKFINVHIQGELAQFADNGNELSHLQNGLPAATISKLVDRLPQIKSVAQPYNSFGGSLPEDDAAFTLRVSERLRHKHRAITIWDYEHLVMAQFQQIFRVKCLNHTNDDSEVAPGSVRVVVIPDIRNQNSFDPFTPRVSKNILSEVTKYLSALNTMHVDLLTINPDYEEVTLDFKVKFYFGFDENAYALQLNTDLITYLSPWAFNKNAAIDFGGTLYKSVLIRFIEELPYVDYIADFRMYFTSTGTADMDILEAGNSKAILVSAKQHLIDIHHIPVCS
jgi:hypothetical protein